MKTIDKRTSVSIKPDCWANCRMNTEKCLSCAWLEGCASDTGQAYQDAEVER